MNMNQFKLQSFYLSTKCCLFLCCSFFGCSCLGLSRWLPTFTSLTCLLRFFTSSLLLSHPLLTFFHPTRCTLWVFVFNIYCFHYLSPFRWIWRTSLSQGPEAFLQHKIVLRDIVLQQRPLQLGLPLLLYFPIPITILVSRPPATKEKIAQNLTRL